MRYTTVYPNISPIEIVTYLPPVSKKTKTSHERFKMNNHPKGAFYFLGLWLYLGFNCWFVIMKTDILKNLNQIVNFNSDYVN